MLSIDVPTHVSGHGAPITYVAWRPDGRRLATCSYDGTVLIWDTTTPTHPVRLAQLRHRRLVNACAWHPDDPQVLATASADKTAAVWRIGDDGAPHLLTVLARHTDDVNAVAWMPDGRRLICVSEDGRASMWDTVTGGLLGEVSSHAAHCMMVSVSRDGLVATVGEDGMVAVTDSGQPGEPVVRHYASSVEGCAWSHDGATLAVARDDGVVDLLGPTLDCLLSVPVSPCAARSVAWADDDQAFAVGAYDGALHLFDTRGQRLRQVHDERMWPRSVSAARGLIAVGSFWSTPHLVRFDTGEPLAVPAAATHGPNAMAVMGDDLLIGCDSGLVLALDLRGDGGDRPVRVIPVADSPILSLAATGDTLYAGTYAGTVIRHHEDPLTGDGIRTVSEQLHAPVPSLCLTGGHLVAGTYSGDLVAMDPASLAVGQRVRAHDGSVKSMVAIPGGLLSAATDRTLAAGPVQQRVPVWEHGNLINAVACLDGRVAATASRDHTVKVGLLGTTAGGDWAVGQIQTLLGADESVKCVALLGTPAAPIVLAGSYDFGVYLWHVDWADSAATLSSGRRITEFRQGVSCMVRLDEHRVAVAGWDTTVMLLTIDRHGLAGAPQVLHVNDLVDRAQRRIPAVAR